MSALSIQPTYPIFTDIDGQPLEDGFAWIGQANLDPQGNPINVFWDAALTIPAGQPIRTLGGYPSNSGTPARLYVNSDYSIRVMNKNGSVVYSAPAATERYSAALVALIGFKGQVGTVEDLAGNDGADWIGLTPSGVGAVPRSAQDKINELVSVFDFMTPAEIANVKAGSGDVTTALQAAFDALVSYQIRSLYFPPGEYRISDTLTPPSPLMAAQFVGASGYDGLRGPINDGLRTRLKWIGATDATKPMVKFDRADGVLWRGISLNCDYKAGYGLQFMSSTLVDPSTKNIVENCSIHYALRDGIIVGEDGDPTAAPGQRQFFGNVFRNLTMFGCARSAIHINEWNADQQMFDTVMVYLDDAPVPQDTLNAFWFDHGGQQSVLLNCQSGGMTVVPGVPSSGFAIKNKADDASPYSTTAGAFGLTVIGFWHEGAGGLYYGVTSINDGKAFVFDNCRSFTSNTANRSVYIDKGTSAQIPYTFINCTFLSDIEIASITFQKQSLSIINCSIAAGAYILGPSGQIVTTQGLYTQVGITANTLTIPRFADLIQVTLDNNVNSVFTEGITKQNDEITLIVTQDGVGGRTINWGGSGQISTLPTVPQPNPAAGAKSTFTFKSNGSNYFLTSVINT